MATSAAGHWSGSRRFGILLLLMLSGAVVTARSEPPDPVETRPAGSGGPEDVARLAKATEGSVSAERLIPEGTRKPTGETTIDADPITRAKQLVAQARSRYQNVRDYTCTFYKRERVNGTLTPQYVLAMKARTTPSSFYFKFLGPYAGREAIWIAGRHEGKVIVHDVGLNKFLAGTLWLEPTSKRAMEDNRHPITEAGIGNLLDTVAQHWERELQPGPECRVSIRDDLKIGTHACTLIESGHPHKRPGYLFHLVRLYMDDESLMPVRFEAYDWPRRQGLAPELVEEYIYTNLRFNVGLTERDFDPSNERYSFGRF